MPDPFDRKKLGGNATQIESLRLHTVSAYSRKKKNDPVFQYYHEEYAEYKKTRARRKSRRRE